MGSQRVLAKGHTLFVADTSVTEMPDSHDLVEIAIEAAHAVRRLGYEPRVAFLSYSTFGNPRGPRGEKVREAVRIMDARAKAPGGGVDFEYEGDMPLSWRWSPPAGAPILSSA